MSKANLLKGGVVVVLLVAALAVFDAYGRYESNHPTGMLVAAGFSVKIVPGWNMVGINALKHAVSTDCSISDDTENVFAFYTQENRYGRYRLSSNLREFGPVRGLLFEDNEKEESARLKNAYPETLAETHAVWFFNDGAECAVNTEFQNVEDFTIQQGWNMISVKPDWHGKRLDEVTNCKVQAAYLFSAQQDWVLLLAQDLVIVASDVPTDFKKVFGAEDIGKGFWVYTDSECQFGQPGQAAVQPVAQAAPSQGQAEKATYKVGEHPVGIAYDGTNIWVALDSRKDLIRINPVTEDISVGTDYLGEGKPQDVFFDGANLWVALHDPDLVVKVSPAKTGLGNVLCTVKEPGNGPYVLDSDGENIWIGHVARSEGKRLRKVSTDCELVNDFPKDKADGNPMYAVFDGENMLVSNGWGVRKISKDGSDLKLIGSVANSRGIAVAGESVWVVDSIVYSDRNRKKEHDGKLTQIRKNYQAASNTILSQRTMKNDPETIDFDGGYLWVTLKTANKVVKLDSGTGNEIGSYGVGQFPVSAVSDGRNLWVVNYDSGDVTKLVGVTRGLFK